MVNPNVWTTPVEEPALNMAVLWLRWAAHAHFLRSATCSPHGFVQTLGRTKIYGGGEKDLLNPGIVGGMKMCACCVLVMCLFRAWKQSISFLFCQVCWLDSYPFSSLFYLPLNGIWWNLPQICRHSPTPRSPQKAPASPGFTPRSARLACASSSSSLRRRFLTKAPKAPRRVVDGGFPWRLFSGNDLPSGNIAMERSTHFSWENPLCLWSFSIAMSSMLNYQRVPTKKGATNCIIGWS